MPSRDDNPGEPAVPRDAPPPIGRLLEVMIRLRSPGGCPWDREQTPATLRRYVLEEAHEVAEAIDVGDWDQLRGELGDLLLQVVFLSRLAEEEGRFGFDDVARAIVEKLVRRHPHVFAGAHAETPEDVARHWDLIKAEERARSGAASASRLDGVPRHMPALARAFAYADKAARAGFDWPDVPSIVDKIDEEARELRAAIAADSREAAAEELGDLLFAAASLARRMGLDPEACLAAANRKFATRLRAVEAEAEARGLRLEELDAETLDALWRRAKRG